MSDRQDARHHGDAPPSGSGSRKRKAQPTTRVKVVASRYAQALQRANLETADAVRASANGHGHGREQAGADPARPSAAAVTRTPQKARAPTVAAPAAMAADDASAAPDMSRSPAQMDIYERLRIYRANKALKRQASASAGASSAVSTNSRAAPRPAFPQRATPPARASGTPGRSVPTPSTVKKAPSAKAVLTAAPARAEPVDTRKTVAAATVLAPQTPRKTLSATTSTTRVPMRPVEEELELLECLYLQMCLADAKADAAFRSQQQQAQQQLLSAWRILQARLELLQDTAIRLDGELMAKQVEEHLHLHADAFVEVGKRIQEFANDLEHVCRSLQASMQHMSTPGLQCDPDELKKQLEAFAAEITLFLEQLQSKHVCRDISQAAEFVRTMDDAVEHLNGLLLQVSNLLDELHREVNVESSLTIHEVQAQRVTSTLDAMEAW